MNIEMLCNNHDKTGENPMWDDRRNVFFWTDIPRGLLWSFDPASGDVDRIYEGDPVGGFTMQEDGRLLLFRVSDVAAFDPATGDVRSLIPFADDGVPRFNDVIAAPDGSVLAGTMGRDLKGGLYHVSLDGTITNLWRGTNCSNGMAFTEDGRTMYWSDSTARQIHACDYDPATGRPTRRTVVVQTPQGEGVPDGMTVDTDGNLLSARWDGHGVFIYTPSGDPVAKIDVPAARPSACIFGGPDLDELYITTAVAGGGGDADGGLYRITGLGRRGRAEFRSRVRL